MTRTRLILTIAIAALLLVAVACGSALPGGSDDAGAPTTREGDGDSVGLSSEGALQAVREDRSEAYEPDAVAGADGSPPPEANPQLDTVLDRKIIQSTSVDMEVDGENGVSRGFQDIIRIAETAGGFVASSSFSNVDDRQFADVTIRVPGTAYQSVLADIRGMGTVNQESSDANDVTEEYSDLAARLRTLNATEQRYLELLARAETINDILVVQDRLDVVRGQIEQVVGRMNLLDNLTDLATITVHLSPLAAAAEPAEGGGSLSPAEAFENAWQASLVALRGIAIGALVVVAFSWWLVPVVAAVAIGARWWMNRGTRAATEAHSL